MEDGKGEMQLYYNLKQFFFLSLDKAVCSYLVISVSRINCYVQIHIKIFFINLGRNCGNRLNSDCPWKN